MLSEQQQQEQQEEDQQQAKQDAPDVEQGQSDIPTAQEVGGSTSTSRAASGERAVPIVVNSNRRGAEAKYYPLDVHTIDGQRASKNWSVGFGLCCFTKSLAISGRYVVPRNMVYLIVCSGGELDLSSAVFIFPTTTITFLAVCGDLEVTLPRGILVEAPGIALCGDFEPPADSPMPDSLNSEEVPKLVLTGFTVCGDANIQINQDKPTMVRVLPS